MQKSPLPPLKKRQRVVHAVRAASNQSKEQQSILFQRDWVITEAEML